MQTVPINLGIDFGTSYTKICYRDIGTEESGVVVAGTGFKHPLIPSIVAIDDAHRLSLVHNIATIESLVLVTYLKMRLARSPIGDMLPSVDGIDLNEDRVIRALAAWFLASVIARSQEWMAKFERDRLNNRIPVWSANVGVPVEHCDSDALAAFREVLGVAWLWIKDGKIPTTLGGTIEEYESCLNRLPMEVTDFHVVPEIAAAVQSFIMSREAVPGIYIYFDVGGGTLDGVAFRYINDRGERRINFYSGKVKSLGLSALAAKISPSPSAIIDAAGWEALLNECPPHIRDSFERQVQLLVAYVIMTAKKKDRQDWQQRDFQSAEFERKFIGRLLPSQMKPLNIFIGGGGSKSTWYKRAIGATYQNFQHHNAGIPPYKLVEVPGPKDFVMTQDGSEDFARFAIAYGLSFPFGEGPEILLPSQFSEAEKLPNRKTPHSVDYLDSKDAYD